MIQDTCIYTVHGLGMAIGWFILIPTGIWMSTAGRLRYPTKWVKYHIIIQAMAATVILGSAALALWVTTPHFDTFHGIIGPCLNVVLITQIIGGILLRWGDLSQRRKWVLKVHRLQGLVLYLGGLVNGFLGAHDYVLTVGRHACQIYWMAMGLGALVMVQVWFAWQILPIWYLHWREEPTVYDQLPTLG